MIRKTILGALASLATVSAALAQTYPINNPVYNPQALIATQAMTATGVSAAFQNNSTPTVCLRILGPLTGLVATVQISEARAQPVGYTPTWTNVPVNLMGGTASATIQQANIVAAGLYCVDSSGLAQLRLNVTSLSTGTVNLTWSGGYGNSFIYPLNRSRATYVVSSLNLTLASAPTDFLTVTGSATTTIRIDRAECNGFGITGTGGDLVALVRSTANTAGTSTTATPISYDTTNPTTGASGLQYTANPTAGTLRGNIRTAKLNNTVNTAVSWDFGPETRTASQEVTLRGVTQVFALNGNGSGLAGTISCAIEYTEE